MLKALALIVLVTLGLLLGLTALVSYPLAHFQHERLVARAPEGRAAVEDVLFHYSAREIDLADSAWGKSTTPEPGEYCRQYRILGREPIDVVYDSQHRVVHIFSSYE
ncbi:MAG: hypothetical protein GY835_16645 [bacterium]|nr:hypothetical protein [bacterium]